MKSATHSFVVNNSFDASAKYPENLRSILNRADSDEARSEIGSWKGYDVTPLTALPQLSARLGIASLHYKDESGRFNLGSFKSLGGAYAVLRILLRYVEEKVGRKIDASELLSGKYAHLTNEMTVCSATDGNHGRSVAWGAKMFGCKCVIYIHATVSEGRKLSIESYGAQVVRVSGNYDDTVRFCASEAERLGHIVVSDTSYEDYFEIPRDVMRGYTVLAAEIVEQFADKAPPTHVFVQSGVGGLAAAVCSYFWEAWAGERPVFVVVEPENAACFCESVRANTPTAVHGDLETMMAGLSCGEVSLIAWDILRVGANAALAVSDDAVSACMRALARPHDGDAAIIAGESAVGGLVGLLTALDDADIRTQLGLNENSVVLCIGSEGATDQHVYESIMESDPAFAAENLTA
ncbi:diaminopropionate ammonia-lyase [Aquamicrobium ahrensii]|uniref:Diaminopropionate ammonia-lyase n=1 Tax=Aquamicrobium ahrensii TaxID=469551 RepID=A0ABV2KRY6_9HYPH